MSLVELSFAGFVLVGLLGIIGIVVIVTGRGPKNLNWKKNVEKKALKEDKSATNFLEPDLPKGETETITDEEEEQEVSTCLLYTSPSPRDLSTSRMPSSA